MTKPTYEQQITEHRASIVRFQENVAIFTVCSMPKSANHWRQAIASAESCIRACETKMRTSNAKHFKVIPNRQYFRLIHMPSGDYIQRHLCDFLTRKDAIACRDRVIAAAPDWNWSDSGFLTDMPWDMSHKVWQAIYAAK